MKITTTLLMPLALFLPACGKQPARRYQHTQWSQPEGAVARLGKGRIGAIEYSPDGTRLAILSSIGIWLYDTESYREIALLAGHTREIADGPFSPDGTTLVSEDQDGTVLLWDTETGEQKGRLTEQVRGIEFSPDGTTLASWSGHNAQLWDAETGEHKRSLAGHTDYVYDVSLSPDGETLVSASEDKTVRVWDTETGEHKSDSHRAHEFGRKRIVQFRW